MTGRADDDELFATLAAATRETPSASRLAAQRARINAAINGERGALRRTLSPVAVAAVAVIAASTAAAAAYVIGVRSGTAEGAPADDVAPAEHVRVSDASAPTPVHADDVSLAERGHADDFSEHHLDTPAAPAAAALAAGATARRPTSPVRRAPRAPLPPPVAADVAIIAAGQDRQRTGAALRRLGGQGLDDSLDAAFVAALAGSDQDGRLRLRRAHCELHLRYGRTAAALSVCRAYALEYPHDDGARPLSFGAGGLAEELGLLDAAVDHYGRAIVLAPLSGASSADALKARARVHARAGRLDEARADLSVYLRLRPSSELDDDVRALASRLDGTPDGVITSP